MRRSDTNTGRPGGRQSHSGDAARQSGDVIQFNPGGSSSRSGGTGSRSYQPDPNNPYDGYDAIDTSDAYDPWDGDGQTASPVAENTNPYDAGDLIDPYDDTYGADGYDPYGEPAAGGYPAPRQEVPVSSYDEAPRRGPEVTPYPRRGPVEPAGDGSGGRATRASRPRHRFRHRGLVVLAVMVAALAGIYQLVFTPIDNELAFSDAQAQTLSGKLSWHLPGMPYYVLALGSDAREGDTVSRTDTMMLVRIDPIESKVTLVSIPRDTKVDNLLGQGTQKINAAYAFGGAGGAVEAVEDLTHASISHVAVVNFDGISTVVDYLGGVTVDVPVAVNDPYYTGLVLPAGEQTMDGNTAMLFSRVRHGFANGDFQRQADQRILLQAILDKCLTLEPSQLPGLIEAVGGLVSTDMRCTSLVPLLLRFMITSPTVYSCGIPGETETIGGVSYVVTDDAQVKALMDRVSAGDDPSTTAEQSLSATG